MPKLSYLKALNRALGDELAADESVFVLGEDVRVAASNLTAGLFDRFGPERVLDTPLSEQAFTNFATGAALAGLRPVIEFQIPSLLFLVFEQIVNQAHKFSLMTGGQCRVPVTYVVTGSGSRTGWAGQHSDHPYNLFAHVGVKTVVPSSPGDAYGLLRSAIRDDDPVVVFAPAGALGIREDVEFADLKAVGLGSGQVVREGSDVTVVALGHLVQEALVVADELPGRVEVFDPRTVYPFDVDGLAASVAKTRRLVVVDDSNRTSGFGAEVLAIAAERFALDVPPRRVTRPDGAVLPFALGLDRAVQPGRDHLVAAVHAVLEGER
ncbi:transketolase C-terminal domain-containing protein [Kribbella sp. NPDC051770]|uniref:alpha-ketoacid dehydrogenase subunit beta n=1 Tax=Kribbella sp. NPDC051770 TaxID=3155413 RepID=UPI0034393D1C